MTMSRQGVKENRCPSCSAGFKTPLACGDCGILMRAVDDRTPFELLGLDVTMEVDAADLRKRLRRFTKLVHPDYFATSSPEQRELAEGHNARLNEAYRIVKDDARRADWIVRHLGGPTEKDLGAMPQEFLMEVMEWNELLEDAEPGDPELEQLGERLRAERADLLASIESALTPLPPERDPRLEDVRKGLNALRYLDRALGHIDR